MTAVGAGGPQRRGPRLVALALFAVAMGWLEGVVVVYIRGLFGMGPGVDIPPTADVVAQFGRLPWLLPTEQSREVATLLMLAAVAWLGARRWRARFGAFLVIFGTWDIVYYLALYAMLRWPPSLATMDVLFLIPPGPWWYQPVWLPVAISAVMIVAGVAMFRRSEPDQSGSRNARDVPPGGAYPPPPKPLDRAREETMNPVRTLSLLFVAAVLACGAGAPAWAAAVPDPPNSTVDPCVRVCPAGDMTFHVVVRDALANPIPGSTVVVDVGGCFGFFLCPPLPPEPYAFGGPSTIVMFTNASGVADFPIRAGGSCVGVINVFADGILLASRPGNTSPDQNGDAMVDATDQALLALKLGGPFDPNADLNCSAALGSGDATVQNAHLGHSCAAVVPVLPSSWGRIKMIYR